MTRATSPADERNDRDPHPTHVPEARRAEFGGDAVVCPHLVARFKSNALWALWPSLTARPARAVLPAPAACGRDSSAGVAYCTLQIGIGARTA